MEIVYNTTLSFANNYSQHILNPVNKNKQKINKTISKRFVFGFEKGILNDITV